MPGYGDAAPENKLAHVALGEALLRISATLDLDTVLTATAAVWPARPFLMQAT